jgi:DNA-directed RNA polymerase subunit H (RpoH/RPB5)
VTETEPVIDDEGNDTGETVEVDKTAEAQAASNAAYQATLDATTASNAKIRTALATVDGLEAAKRVAEPDGDIPKTVTETDIDGNVTERPYKAWAEYDAAQATIAGATDATNQFALVRSMGVQTETLPKTETTTEPILNEDGTESGETREVVTVVKGETIPNPDYAAYKAAWDAVDADLN